MQTAKLFGDENHQSVKLPENCRFEGSDVYIKKFENIVILLPKDNPWLHLEKSLDKFTDDFMDDRNQPVLQNRVDL